MEINKGLEKANGNHFAEAVLTYILDRGEMSNKDTFIALVKTGLTIEEIESLKKPLKNH